MTNLNNYINISPFSPLSNCTELSTLFSSCLRRRSFRHCPQRFKYAYVLQNSFLNLYEKYSLKSLFINYLLFFICSVFCAVTIVLNHDFIKIFMISKIQFIENLFYLVSPPCFLQKYNMSLTNHLLVKIFFQFKNLPYLCRKKSLCAFYGNSLCAN